MVLTLGRPKVCDFLALLSNLLVLHIFHLPMRLIGYVILELTDIDLPMLLLFLFFEMLPRRL